MPVGPVHHRRDGDPGGAGALSGHQTHLARYGSRYGGEQPPAPFTWSARRPMSSRGRIDGSGSFLDQLEPVDVEQAEIGDLHVGDDRQRQEGDLEERLRQRAAEVARRLARAASARRGPPRRARGSSARRAAAPARPAPCRPSATTKPPPISRSRLTATAMSSSSMPTTQMLWLSWPTEEAMAPRCMPKPVTKARPIVPSLPWRSMTATLAMSLAGSATRSLPFAGTCLRTWSVTTRPGATPIIVSSRRHRGCGNRPAPICAHLDAVEADRRDRAARGEERVVDHAAGRDHRLHRAFGEIADQHDIGAAAGRDHAAVAQAEGVCRRPARGAIDVVQRPAEGDQRAHHVVEVALLGDVERVAVVGAQAAHARRMLVEDLGERVQVLGHRALADQHGEALLQLLAAVLGDGRLVVGADARGEIAVEVVAAHQRRVAVDVAVLEGDELVEHVVAARQARRGNS